MRNNTADLVKTIAVIVLAGIVGTALIYVLTSDADPVKECRQSAVQDFDNGKLESTSALDDALAACANAAG